MNTNKKIAITLALLLSSPRILYVLTRYYLYRSVLGQDDALLDTTDLMRGWRGVTGMLARRLVLGVVLGEAFEKHVTVYNTLFSKGGIRIGKNTYIGFDCNIGNVKIGHDVLISDGVTIMSGGHQHGIGSLDQPYQYQQGDNLTLEIGSGTWIGAGAIIMASVGTGVVIGAGSVVTKPVPDNQLAVGVPARLINKGH